MDGTWDSKIEWDKLSSERQIPCFCSFVESRPSPSKNHNMTWCERVTVWDGDQWVGIVERGGDRGELDCITFYMYVILYYILYENSIMKHTKTV
jgi:hypothetical protein